MSCVARDPHAVSVNRADHGRVHKVFEARTAHRASRRDPPPHRPEEELSLYPARRLHLRRRRRRLRGRGRACVGMCAFCSHARVRMRLLVRHVHARFARLRSCGCVLRGLRDAARAVCAGMCRRARSGCACTLSSGRRRARSKSKRDEKGTFWTRPFLISSRMAGTAAISVGR
eukprot:SAG11_NODE_335_length_10564_cov_23.976015_3_plen_173_part_00